MLYLGFLIVFFTDNIPPNGRPFGTRTEVLGSFCMVSKSHMLSQAFKTACLLKDRGKNKPKGNL